MLPRVESQLPNDVKVQVIRIIALSVCAPKFKPTLVLGILASLSLVFMRSWRSTLIARLRSLLGDLNVWSVRAQLHANSVTMLALVLMVGRDRRRDRGAGKHFPIHWKAHRSRKRSRATKDIGLGGCSVTTLSLVVIFLPVSFMSSISAGSLQFGIPRRLPSWSIRNVC